MRDQHSANDVVIAGKTPIMCPSSAPDTEAGNILRVAYLLCVCAFFVCVCCVGVRYSLMVVILCVCVCVLIGCVRCPVDKQSVAKHVDSLMQSAERRSFAAHVQIGVWSFATR